MKCILHFCKKMFGIASTLLYQLILPIPLILANTIPFLSQIIVSVLAFKARRFQSSPFPSRALFPLSHHYLYITSGTSFFKSNSVFKMQIDCIALCFLCQLNTNWMKMKGTYLWIITAGHILYCNLKYVIESFNQMLRVNYYDIRKQRQKLCLQFVVDNSPFFNKNDFVC